MTWREQLISRILILLAMLVCEDEHVKAELKHLGNHISVTVPKAESKDA